MTPASYKVVMRLTNTDRKFVPHIAYSGKLPDVAYTHPNDTLTNTAVLQTFYGSLDFVRDNLGKPVPEK